MLHRIPQVKAASQEPYFVQSPSIQLGEFVNQTLS